MVPKSSDNPGYVAHQNKIIWQIQIRLIISCHHHVDENDPDIKKVRFEVTIKCYYSVFADFTSSAITLSSDSSTNTNIFI